jgi:hypothetical protein
VKTAVVREKKKKGSTEKPRGKMPVAYLLNDSMFYTRED